MKLSEHVARDGISNRRRPAMVGIVVASLLAGYSGPAAPEELAGDVVLAADAKTVTWAAIYRKPAPGGEDPWYHIEVIEKDRRSEPWVFRRLATHMAITPAALLASRSDKRPKTYGYKNEQFITAYRQWQGQSREIRDGQVCRSTVLDCLRRAQED
jgi:hypothetical protein